MAGLAYMVWFEDRSATQEELDRIEEIVVEQEMDMVWEARIRMYLCLDEKGRWKHGAEGFAKPFSRVRVELRNGGDTFTPLIDGPVAAFDTALDSQPGRSTVTIAVRDDSVLLNRKETVDVLEGQRADDIARKLFENLPRSGPRRLQATPSPETVAVQRGTPIALLRKLAVDHGFHAYVLPGPDRGASVGCFLPDPEVAGTLPPLVLLGEKRNVADIDVRENPEAPQNTVVRTLRIGDMQIVTSETKVKDLELMRELAPLEDSQLAQRLVAPGDSVREDPKVASVAHTRRAAYAYKVTGRVVPGCYPGVLVPYERVSVQAGRHSLSGSWLLTKVTHRITPSVYTQEFEAKADSRSDPGSPEAEASKPGGMTFELAANVGVL